jgi:hypothetical protein
VLNRFKYSAGLKDFSCSLEKRWIKFVWARILLFSMDRVE